MDRHSTDKLSARLITKQGPKPQPRLGFFYVHGRTGRCLLLGNSSCVALLSYIRVTMQYLHFHHPWWSYSARSQDGGAVMSMDGRAENCSSAIAPALPYYRPSLDICIFRTSHFLVGRISQRARKAMRLSPE